RRRGSSTRDWRRRLLKARRRRGAVPAASCTSPTTSPGNSPVTAPRRGSAARHLPTASSTTFGRCDGRGASPGDGPLHLRQPFVPIFTRIGTMRIERLRGDSREVGKGRLHGGAEINQGRGLLRTGHQRVALVDFHKGIQTFHLMSVALEQKLVEPQR